jgi:hypothetical protein
MAYLNKTIDWFLSKELEDIAYFKENPIEVQQRVLHNLVGKAKDTEWGVQYDYASLQKKNLHEYSQRVPLQEYDQIKHHIERMRKGESQILWDTDIRWFSKSSGTTNDKSKYIPVSMEALNECHYKAGKDIIAIYNQLRPESRVLTGKTLVLGGSYQIDTFSPENKLGDVSAILIQNLPFWAQWLRTPTRKIALMPEWEEKLELMALDTIKERVTSLAGVPSWTLILLKRVLEITGADNLQQVWPELELFVHGGVSFTPYRKQFDKLIDPSRMNYLETYNASEGFFAMQDDLETDDMLLMLNYGIYYEFIPMDTYHQNPQAIPLAQVELNRNYAIVISTNAGLWRYIIGDTVKFTSLRPYKIKITGRTRHFINAFGEEVIIDNAEKALAVACQATGAIITEYTAAPIYISSNEQGAHEWLIEFAKEPDTLENFTQQLDTALKRINSDYEAKRYHDKILRLPQINIAPRGLFNKWLEIRGKLGGQHKVPRLSNSRKLLEELLEIANPK